MKTIEMAEATAPLAEYARQARREALVVTLKGRPVAVLAPIAGQKDHENIAVSSDPAFRELIERSRRRYPAGSGLTADAVRRRLAPRRAGRRAVK